jgi:hypothetical protein
MADKIAEELESKVWSQFFITAVALYHKGTKSIRLSCAVVQLQGLFWWGRVKESMRNPIRSPCGREVKGLHTQDKLRSFTTYSNFCFHMS